MRKYNRGSALISALFIMTLVAIAATAMSTRLHLDIYRTRLTILTDKMYLASQAVSFWAMAELNNPKNVLRKADNSGKVLDFPSKLNTLYPGFQTKGALFDLQSRFNLNNIATKPSALFFLRLLENPSFKLHATQRKDLLEAAMQWLTLYQPGRGNDALMTYYLKQNPAYLPSHQPLQSPSEMRLWRGVDAGVYQQLEGLITVLPEQTPLNINTAPPVLLKALGNGLSDNQLNQLLSVRKTGIKSLEKIASLLEKAGINRAQISLESQYFLSIAYIEDSELSLINYTILKRQMDKQGKISISLIAESLNTL